MFLPLFSLNALFLIGIAALPQGAPAEPGASPGSEPLPGGSHGYEGTPQSPAYPWLFEHPLPIPSVAEPILTQQVNGRTIQYFQLTIQAFEQQIYPDLGAAHLVGYSKNLIIAYGWLEKSLILAIRWNLSRTNVHAHERSRIGRSGTK